MHTLYIFCYAPNAPTSGRPGFQRALGELKPPRMLCVW